MAIPNKNVLGNPNVTEGDFQIALESLRESVVGSGKTFDSANTYMTYDTCIYAGVEYYSKVDNNIGNTPIIGANWGLSSDIKASTKAPITNPTFIGTLLINGSFGFTTGSGAQVTQPTNKSTQIACNKPTALITMNNASLPAGVSVEFAISSTAISGSGTDVVTISPYFGTVDPRSYDIKCSFIGGNNFAIKVTNISGVARAEALQFMYIITKGAIS